MDHAKSRSQNHHRPVERPSGIETPTGSGTGSNSSHFDQAAATWDDNLIVSNMTLHHIADTRKVLHAFFHLLTPGGSLAIADLDTEPGEFHPAEVAQGVHHHGFDRAELAVVLRALGFQQTRHLTAHTVRKPGASGVERDFPVFLLTARKAAE